MKILHIITRLILGGAQQNTLLTCAGQKLEGHQVNLAFGPIYGPEGSLLDAARATGASLREINSLRRPVLPLHDWVCYRAIRRLIERIQPDVVHTHSSKAGVLGRWGAWAQQVPAIVHTVHGLPFHDRQNPMGRRAYIAAERFASRRCHHLIAVAPELVNAFGEEKIATPDRFTVVRSGIDLNAFHIDALARLEMRGELNISSDAPVLGMLGRLDVLKGHDDLLDVMPDLLGHIPGLRVLLVGDGYRHSHLERRLKIEGLDQRVCIMGLVAPNRVGRLLNAIDVMVLPSYQEGQPRILAEALLSGCGIVCYDVGGSRSICINDQTGKLIPLGDKPSLASAIIWMFKHPKQRQTLNECGREHVMRVFDSKIMVQMIEHVYRKVLERN